MLQILISFILTILQKLFTLIFTPFMSLLNTVFSALGMASLFTHITDLLYQVLLLVPYITKLLLIPSGALSILFVYYNIKITIYLVKTGVNFLVNLYNKLKP